MVKERPVLIDSKLLLRAYELMHTAKGMADLYDEQKDVCAKYVHSTSRGHEAIQLAAAFHLRAYDYAAPYYRDESMLLGIGLEPWELMLQLMAKKDDPFSGGTAEGRVGETKSVAAARIMSDFVSQRKNDMIGVVTFSNSAMYVLPLTDSREAVLAAISATAGNSLFQTNIGGGLSSAVSLFEHVPDSGSRAIILISDGAGRVGAEVQQKLRDWLERYNLSLYWVVLRQPAGVDIFDPKYQDHYEEMLPSEVELYNYFKLLRTPFHAYQAEDPKSLAAAIADINQKEKKPIKYMKKIPGHDYTQLCYFIAALMIGLLLSVKYFELRTWNTKP